MCETSDRDDARRGNQYVKEDQKQEVCNKNNEILEMRQGKV